MQLPLPPLHWCQILPLHLKCCLVHLCEFFLFLTLSWVVSLGLIGRLMWSQFRKGQDSSSRFPSAAWSLTTTGFTSHSCIGDWNISCPTCDWILLSNSWLAMINPHRPNSHDVWTPVCGCPNQAPLGFGWMGTHPGWYKLQLGIQQ